jgi:hypothetical protein
VNSIIPVSATVSVIGAGASADGVSAPDDGMARKSPATTATASNNNDISFLFLIRSTFLRLLGIYLQAYLHLFNIKVNSYFCPCLYRSFDRPQHYFTPVEGL